MNWKFKINITRRQTLLFITILIAIYYLVCGIYINNLGYFNQETLFYIEKVRIIFEGTGYKLKVIGLTAPALPFFATFPFTVISSLLAPVIASALGTAVLFYLMASTLVKKTDDDYYLFLLIIMFLFHPGILYTACSGKAIYMALIFFYMFFLNIFKFYTSNTTFHISIASICLVLLLFCDYKFIWLTLFFIPLIFSIALQSLNLAEKESLFRMTQSFNSPSLRRKLINKTFALYVILFILPIASIICYKLLNLTNANDADYFLSSPYATWNVIAERFSYETAALNPDFKSPEVSVLLSARMVMFCPLILFAIALFWRSTYQILTLLTPFAFVEFLHIKYDKAFLVQEYYLIFLVLAVLCFIIKAQPVKHRLLFKVVLTFIILLQFYTGYYFLSNSLIDDERNFVTILKDRTEDTQQDENKDMANYINGLPDGSKVLADDAIAYPIVAFTNDVGNMLLPYQDNFMGAVETPGQYVGYILIANAKNTMAGYSILNARYGPVMFQTGNNYSTLQKAYETDHWTLYKLY
ncbi:hypothetical protein [Mucilaginibacter sp. dw_454]|uniref:hypothetical protein n=1 Tax=Mucilaginibacter sp. dw_454 TaxID=2720079 RepID=UPI001BD3E712|nr:hypothetical protein [Mucilaginibacter sp. dw_454]